MRAPDQQGIHRGAADGAGRRPGHRRQWGLTGHLADHRGPHLLGHGDVVLAAAVPGQRIHVRVGVGQREHRRAGQRCIELAEPAGRRSRPGARDPLARLDVVGLGHRLDGVEQVGIDGVGHRDALAPPGRRRGGRFAYEGLRRPVGNAVALAGLAAAGAGQQLAQPTGRGERRRQLVVDHDVTRPASGLVDQRPEHRDPERPHRVTGEPRDPGWRQPQVAALAVEVATTDDVHRIGAELAQPQRANARPQIERRGLPGGERRQHRLDLDAAPEGLRPIDVVSVQLVAGIDPPADLQPDPQPLDRLVAPVRQAPVDLEEVTGGRCPRQQRGDGDPDRRVVVGGGRRRGRRGVRRGGRQHRQDGEGDGGPEAGQPHAVSASRSGTFSSSRRSSA